MVVVNRTTSVLKSVLLSFVHCVKKSAPQRRREWRRKREELAGESGMKADRGLFATKAINQIYIYMYK